MIFFSLGSNRMEGASFIPDLSLIEYAKYVVVSGHQMQ